MFVLTICLFCTFGFDIDFLFCFTFFTLNLLFSFSLKYLISVQKFDILPSSLQSSVLVCVRVRLCLCTFDLRETNEKLRFFAEVSQYKTKTSEKRFEQ